MLESFWSLSERMRGRGSTLWCPACIRMLKVIIPDGGSGGRNQFQTMTLCLIKEGFWWISHHINLSFWGRKFMNGQLLGDLDFHGAASQR